MSLTRYRTLGRSGLVVSPAALGTMTFGTPRWGSTDEVSKDIFNAYVDAGGNFIDTADVYSGGQSETLLGNYIAERKLRDRLVLATKFSFNFSDGDMKGSGLAGNPNAGGNGRKNLRRALEGSLRRLRTDCIDLYWMHVWDRVTPVEEMLQSLGDLVRAGKIRYFGFSDMPAWYAVKAATLASAHAVPGPVAMQLAYSLVERSIEREHVPAARECGMGITPWSPLAAGFLAGKYRRSGETATGEGRLVGASPFGNMMFTERNWKLLETLREVSAQAGLPMSQVALAWAAAQPGISSLILGASRLEQLHDNIAALDVKLDAANVETLNKASALDAGFPYPIFSDETNTHAVFGGMAVEGWR